MSGVKVMRLRYCGVCACGAELAQGERAAYDRAAKVVRCLPCHDTASRVSPPAQSDEAPEIVTRPPALDVGVAGAGARLVHGRRKANDDAARAERSRVWRALNTFFYPDGRQSTNAWKVGAVGEELVGQALNALVDAGHGYALHDRRIPGKRSNIDHLLVVAAGVFVIDSKHYRRAEVSVERTGGLFGPVNETLKIGGRRKNDLVEALKNQGNIVHDALAAANHSDVPVIPVLCFVDASLTRRAQKRGVAGVRVSGRKGLARLAAQPGPLDDEQRFAVAMALSTALPSMS